MIIMGNKLVSVFLDFLTCLYICLYLSQEESYDLQDRKAFAKFLIDRTYWTVIEPPVAWKMRLHRIGAAVHLSNGQNPKRAVAVAVAANWQDLRKMSKTMGYASSPSFGCKDMWMQIRPWLGMVWLDGMFNSGLTASESSNHSFKLMDGHFDLFSLVFRLSDIFTL